MQTRTRFFFGLTPKSDLSRRDPAVSLPLSPCFFLPPQKTAKPIFSPSFPPLSSSAPSSSSFTHPHSLRRNKRTKPKTDVPPLLPPRRARALRRSDHLCLCRHLRRPVVRRGGDVLRRRQRQQGRVRWQRETYGSGRDHYCCYQQPAVGGRGQLRYLHRRARHRRWCR